MAVHLMHAALVARWAGSMAFAELAVSDPSDPVSLNALSILISYH